MKRHLLLSLLLTLSAWATTRTVGVAPCVTTIAACINLSSPGDTVIVRASDSPFAELVSVGVSGSAGGGYITIKTDGGGTVQVYGFTVNGKSYIQIGDRNFGFRMTATGTQALSGLVQLNGNNDHIRVWGNTIGGPAGNQATPQDGGGGNKCIHSLTGAYTTFLDVGWNDIEWCGKGAPQSTTWAPNFAYGLHAYVHAGTQSNLFLCYWEATTVTGNSGGSEPAWTTGNACDGATVADGANIVWTGHKYGLSGAGDIFGANVFLHDNTIAHVADGWSPYGPNFTFQNDIFGPNTCSDIGIASDTDVACNEQNYHVDYNDHGNSGASPLLNDCVYQGITVVRNSSQNGHFGLWQAGTSGEQRCIVRFNVVNYLGADAAVFNNTTVGKYAFWKSYNNIWYVNATTPQCGVLIINDPTNPAVAKENASINNIFAYPSNPASGCASGPYVISLSSTTKTTFSASHDLFFKTGCASNCFHADASGNFDPNTETGAVLNQDPLFVNGAAATFNGHLQALSPARNAGTNQAVVHSSDSGSGTVLYLADAIHTSQDGAPYFTAGNGVLPGDCIWINTFVNRTCITAIDYSVSPAKVTVSPGITRSSGQAVGLYSINGNMVVTGSTTPHIGAFPDSVSPLSLDFGNQNTGTPSTARTITLSNWSNASIAITSIVNSDLVNYALDSAGCISPLGAFSACTVTVIFNPTTDGLKLANITFTDGASDSPQVVSLSGTGVPVPVAPVINTFTADLAYVKPGGHFTFTVATVGADIGCSAFAQTSGGNAQVIGPITCNGTFTWNPYDTYPLINFNEYFTVWMNALGSGGSTDSRTTGKYAIVYEQKWVSAGRKPF